MQADVNNMNITYSLKYVFLVYQVVCVN